jgi:predicted transcriptional regulator
MLYGMPSAAAMSPSSYDRFMRKGRVRVKIDKALLEALRAYGLLDGRDLDDVVNEALREVVEAEARERAIDAWLDEQDEEFGPPSEEALAAARATWDEFDALPAPESRRP